MQLQSGNDEEEEGDPLERYFRVPCHQIKSLRLLLRLCLPSYSSSEIDMVVCVVFVDFLMECWGDKSHTIYFSVVFGIFRSLTFEIEHFQEAAAAQ